MIYFWCVHQYNRTGVIVIFTYQIIRISVPKLDWPVAFDLIIFSIVWNSEFVDFVLNNRHLQEKNIAWLSAVSYTQIDYTFVLYSIYFQTIITKIWATFRPISWKKIYLVNHFIWNDDVIIGEYSLKIAVQYFVCQWASPKHWTANFSKIKKPINLKEQLNDHLHFRKLKCC